MQDYSEEILGFWEEPGVIGSRIEIEKDRLIVLWRGAPVLETKYKLIINADGNPEIIPNQKGLKNPGSSVSYADITGLIFKDGKLEFTKDFSISGESKDILSKTTNNRYGNYDIVDEMLPEISGKWKDEKGFINLEIKGNTMILNNESTHIHVLKSRSGWPSACIIADVDPSRDNWQGFDRFQYENGRMITHMLVYDLGSFEIMITRQ